MRQDERRTRHELRAVWLLLFATGWAGNHFAAMLPVLARSEGFSRAVLDSAYGIYAVGLVPALIGGGYASDRVGRRTLVLLGATVAALGNTSLVSWHDQAGMMAGRFVVGLGVGIAMSVGTAWCADLGGSAGSAQAGVFLTAGIGCGPLVAGVIAELARRSVGPPFAVTIGLSALAVVIGVVVTRPTVGNRETTAEPDAARDDSAPSGTWAALAAGLPMALFVFSCATVAIVSMSERMQGRFGGPLLPGIASVVVMTAGASVQALGRRRRWGRGAGVFGAACAALGFAATAAAGPTPTWPAFVIVAVVLGVAYGLCLRAGLIDVETLSPPALRGTLTGVFYAATYLGFGVPVLLVSIAPWAGLGAPLMVLAALAVAVAVLRHVQVRRDGSRHRPRLSHQIRDDSAVANAHHSG